MGEAGPHDDEIVSRYSGWLAARRAPRQGTIRNSPEGKNVPPQCLSDCHQAMQFPRPVLGRPVPCYTTIVVPVFVRV